MTVASQRADMARPKATEEVLRTGEELVKAANLINKTSSAKLESRVFYSPRGLDGDISVVPRCTDWRGRSKRTESCRMLMQWDRSNERFVGDEDANKLLENVMREPG